MKKHLPIISVVLALLLLVGTLLLDKWIDRERLEQVSTLPVYTRPITDDTLTTEPIETGRDDAPEFTVTDKGGNKVSLSQFRGKTVVVNFWASWAGPSKRELAMYEQAYKDHKDDVYFLIINTTSDSRETREKADQFIQEGGYTFPVYYDLDASAANTYGVISLPTSFFIDANGKAIAYAAGELDRSKLEAGLQYCQRSADAAGGADTTEPTLTTDPTQATETE